MKCRKNIVSLLVEYFIKNRDEYRTCRFTGTQSTLRVFPFSYGFIWFLLVGLIAGFPAGKIMKGSGFE